MIKYGWHISVLENQRNAYMAGSRGNKRLMTALLTQIWTKHPEAVENQFDVYEFNKKKLMMNNEKQALDNILSPLFKLLYIYILIEVIIELWSRRKLLNVRSDDGYIVKRGFYYQSVHVEDKGGISSNNRKEMYGSCLKNCP
jgi:hypothetical protein